MNNLVLGETELGKAVFANRDFGNGEVIIDFKGEPMRKKDLPIIMGSGDDHYLQIGPNKFIGPSGDFDDFFNHSCNPNSGIIFKDGRIFLVSITDIKKGEEIMFDYSTTVDGDKWNMSCKCGSKNCRGIIGDFKFLSEGVKQKYISLGIVPNYLVRKTLVSSSSIRS